MRRVLFVDHDPAVLEGLRNALWRTRWEMSFARTGEEALARLAEQPFDVIVSDMVMPGMDGPELLTRVRESYPHIVRLCLSGTIDDEAFLRAVSVAHQFLNKPCDPDTLREVVERACALRGILQSETIRALVGRLNQLPGTSEISRAVTKAVSEPNAHTADITGIVSRDATLCVKILQIVNSALFRRSAPINSIQAAITFVGMEMIKSLALSASVFHAVDASPAAARLLQDLQARSLRKGRFARLLLQNSRQADEAFTAALLLDIGQAVLALDAPEKFEQALASARASNRPLHEIETEMFGVSHPEIGACLLGLWGLPLELIEAVAYHHVPSRVEHAQTRVLAAVHVADVVIDATGDANVRLHQLLGTAFVDRTEVARCIESWNIDVDADASSAQQVVNS